MTNAEARKLHLVQPDLERVCTWLISVAKAIVEIYWWLLKSYGTIMLLLIATGLMVGGMEGLIRVPSLWWVALPAIGIGAALWISRRFRVFIWAYLGFGLLWAISISAPLRWIVGPHYPELPAATKIWIAVIYAVPPLIGALIADRMRDRKG